MNRLVPERPIYSPAPEEELVDLGAWLQMLWRGKGLMMLIALLTASLAAFYATRVATPLFEARAVVMLESREEKIVDLKDVISGLSGDETVINSEVEVLRGRELMRSVVARLGLTDDPEFNPGLRPPDRLALLKEDVTTRIKAQLGIATAAKPVPQAHEIENAAIDRLLKRLTIRNLPDSLVFQIIAETESPAKSARIANTVVETYIDNQLAVKSEATEAASRWLHGRVAELKQELAQDETRLSEARANTDLLEPRARAVLEDRIRNLRTELGPARVGEAELLARAKEPLQRTAPISAARLSPGALGPIAELSTLMQRLEANAEKTSLLDQLGREAEASRFLYETFLARMKETSVQLGIQKPDSRLLSRAAIPARPSAPNVARLIAIAAVLGAMLGAAIHLLREAGQTAFRSTRELELFSGHRVLGQIPALRNRKLTAIRSYLARRPNSAMAEALRNLRTSLFFNGSGTPPQIIALSSALPGEGKTTLSLALAQNIAQMGQKVLLIEGDIRRGQVRKHFGQRAARGLLAVLTGQANLTDVTYHSRAIGADVLFGERSALNSSDLFSNPNFEQLLTEAREIYDTIVIDTPPVLIVPDARIIAQSADSTLFVVKWNRTTQHQVEEALHMFETVHVPVTGLVMNQISLSGMRRYGVAGGLGTYKALGRKYYQV